MDVSAYGVSAPGPVYEIGGRRFEVASSEFAESIANAHAARQRPRCLCTPVGVEMYVARLAGPHGGYIVKRMPDTGCRHDRDCPSYEPPAELSGLGQVLGTAITEDPATGQTSLRLGFSLTKLPGRSQMPGAGGESESVCTDGTKLSLRGLLHYLWDQAELTKWHPGFAGKRTWGTVRWRLLKATEHRFAGGVPLRSRLYVPEPFSVNRHNEITARRLEQWKIAAQSPGNHQRLMLLVAEAKEICPAKFGYQIVIKHLPDVCFAIDKTMYQRLGKTFGVDLKMWCTSNDTRLILIATFSTPNTGPPYIHDLSLMSVTRQWLPIRNSKEKMHVEQMTRAGWAFAVGQHCMHST